MDFESNPNSSSEELNQDNPQRRSFCRDFYVYFAAAICVLLAFTVILTYTLTAAAKRDAYTKALLAKDAELQALRDEFASPDLTLFDQISKMLAYYSYYGNNMSREEMIHAALNAYVAATGDKYAAYYTVEEYEKLNSEHDDYAGIGVATVTDTKVIENTAYLGFSVTEVYEQSPAERAGIKRGDFICQIKVDGVFRTVEELGGHDLALSYIRGEIGSTIDVRVWRNEEAFVDFSITREMIEVLSVTHAWKNNDKTTKTAVVSIKRFDSKTPQALRSTVDALLAEGAEHFVFDLRNNPGGSLLSIKAVMSYFLQENDKIIDAIDKNGSLKTSYVVEPMSYSGEYAAYNVAKEEIGIYKDLDMVVLCNGNTASAAEVFTATLRDYGMATIVGERTFGKGIMQSEYNLAMFGDYSGYLKLTTYAYVTKCGVSYHDIGIAPNEGYEVVLEDSDTDNQLQKAFSVFEK